MCGIALNISQIIIIVFNTIKRVSSMASNIVLINFTSEKLKINT